jgi:hypothetical protein
MQTHKHSSVIRLSGVPATPLLRSDGRQLRFERPARRGDGLDCYGVGGALSLVPE